MSRYLLQRLVQSVGALVALSLLMFVLLRLTGDPASAILGPDATRSDIANFQHAWGLDRPLWEQYVTYMAHAATGDFGLSFRSYQPALSLVLDRLPNTAKLVAGAMLVALVVSIPLGMAAGIFRNGPIDALATGIAVLGQAIPGFYLGIVLILVVGVQLRWLPTGGGSGIESLVLPVVALGLHLAGVLARLLRSSLIECLGTDYVRTARGKGLTETSVMARHVMKNAALPVLTVLGLQIGSLFGGAIVTENVFAYPGMGLLLSQAISHRDFAVLQAAVLMIGAVVIIVNLATDVAYSYLDPRIRYT